MCILFFALKQHPEYPVIICANRDEFHQRPSLAMHYWQSPEILAGKDLQAGGTWLGLTPQGRFSALTNFRQPAQQDNTKKSRGDLVLQALLCSEIKNSQSKGRKTKTEQELKKSLTKTATDYNGFNLVFGELNNLQCFDNISKKFKPLPDGIHSICNGALDDIWPKMALGQQQLAGYIASHQSPNNQALAKQHLEIETLFTLMKNNQQAQAKLLPNTGVPEHWEQLLSSIFITSADYGTRTTTIITQDNQGKISIYDRSYNSEGLCTTRAEFFLTR